jgi:hypothetical protein
MFGAGSRELEPPGVVFHGKSLWKLGPCILLLLNPEISFAIGLAAPLKA